MLISEVFGRLLVHVDSFERERERTRERAALCDHISLTATSCYRWQMEDFNANCPLGRHVSLFTVEQ